MQSSFPNLTLHTHNLFVLAHSLPYAFRFAGRLLTPWSLITLTQYVCYLAVAIPHSVYLFTYIFPFAYSDRSFQHHLLTTLLCPDCIECLIIQPLALYPSMAGSGIINPYYSGFHCFTLSVNLLSTSISNCQGYAVPCLGLTQVQHIHKFAAVPQSILPV